MKEGEVAILRTNMEKVGTKTTPQWQISYPAHQSAQEHAIQVANLKAEKETLDAKQTQMQKDMKDEVERLKTQFLFKVSLSTILHFRFITKT